MKNKKPVITEELPPVSLPEKPDLVDEIRRLHEKVDSLMSLLTGGGLRLTVGLTAAESTLAERRAAELGSVQRSDHTPASGLVVGGWAVGDLAWYPYPGDGEDDPARPERIKITGLTNDGRYDFEYLSDGASASDDDLDKLFDDSDKGKALAELYIAERDSKAVQKLRHRALLTVKLFSEEPSAKMFAKLKSTDIATIASIVGLSPFHEPLKSKSGDDRVRFILKAAQAFYDKPGGSKCLREAQAYLERTKGTLTAEEIEAARERLKNGPPAPLPKGGAVNDNKEEPTPEEPPSPSPKEWVEHKGESYRIVKIDRGCAVAATIDRETGKELVRKTFPITKIRFLRYTKKMKSVWTTARGE